MVVKFTRTADGEGLVDLGNGEKLERTGPYPKSCSSRDLRRGDEGS